MDSIFGPDRVVDANPSLGFGRRPDLLALNNAQKTYPTQLVEDDSDSVETIYDETIVDFPGKNYEDIPQQNLRKVTDAPTSPGPSHVSDSICNSEGSHGVSDPLQLQQAPALANVIAPDFISSKSSFQVNNPIVHKDLRIISKFWADGEDEALEEESNDQLAKSPNKNDSDVFNVALSKSQKKKLRQKKKQIAEVGNVHKALSRAGPKNFA